MANVGQPPYVGQYLNYNGVTTSFFSPFDEVYIVDDLIVSNSGGTLFNSILSWNSDLGGTGAGYNAQNIVLSTNPGIIQLNTGTTTTGYNNIRQAPSSGADTSLLGGGAISLQWVVKMPTLSNGTDTFVTRIGLGSNTNTDFTNGVYFEGDSNTNSHWLIKTASASTRSSTTTTNVIDTNFHRYRMDINSGATSVTFYIDDVSQGTIATNIPTAAACSFYVQMVKSAGTTNRTLQVDLMTFYQKLTTSR